MPFGTRTTKIAEFRIAVGPGRNKTIGGRGSPKKINLPKELVCLQNSTPQRPFSGVFGISFLCRAKANLHRGRRLGIWGVDCTAYRPWYLPTCCANHFTFLKKRKNGPNIASFNDHAHVICWNYEKSSCTCGILVKFWYKNIMFVPKLEITKELWSSQ